MTATNKVATRVRHPLKFRVATVSRVQKLAPHMLRVTFTGADFADFASASFDDHVKVFFPAPGQNAPVLPQMGEAGLVWPEGEPRPAARDYTPRRFNNAAGELVIDFALHGEGPAAEWAARAAVGQILGIGGPRGSLVIPNDFDWYVLFADETGLPAVGRFLAEALPGTRVTVFAEVASAAEQIALPELAGAQIQWLYRGQNAPGSALLAAAKRLSIPSGDSYVWAAGESASMQALRAMLIEQGLDKSRIRAAAYWKRGDTAHHATIED